MVKVTKHHYSALSGRGLLMDQMSTGRGGGRGEKEFSKKRVKLAKHQPSILLANEHIGMVQR